MKADQYKLEITDIYAGVREKTSESRYGLKVKNTALNVMFVITLTSVIGMGLVVNHSRVLAEESQNAKDSLQPAFDIIRACISDKPQPIKIGDEYFMCGINSLGKFK